MSHPKTSILALCLAFSVLASSAPDARAQPSRASEEVPVVELYTIGQSRILFEKFGHAVLCLRYPRQPQRDVCFNYGTADFSSPIALGWGFFRGQKVFWVGTSTPARMLSFYRARDRTIWLQRLPLEPDQVRELMALIDNDNLPENKYYRYEFFTENCTTRLRDLIDKVTGGRLSENSSHGVGRSFRDLARIGLAEDTLVLIASDFVLSRSTDKEISLWDLMFLPDYLRAEITTRLGAEPTVVYERGGSDISQDPGWGGRGWLLLGILLLSVPALLTRLIGRRETLALRISLVPLVLFGIAVWGLAIICPMEELRINEALLVFFPGDVVLFKATRWRRRYSQVRFGLVILVSLLLAVGLFTQPLWVPMLFAFFPLLALALPASVMPAAAAATADSAEETNEAAKGPARTPKRKPTQKSKSKRRKKK